MCLPMCLPMCLSVDRIVQGSIRVMPACMVTGEAAGTAAAIVARDGITARELDISSVQKILTENGAFLPNYEK